MIPAMKLTFSLNQDSTWNKIITYVSDGSIFFEKLNLFLSLDNMNKDYFDDWEIQIKSFPNVNIVEVERFI